MKLSLALLTLFSFSACSSTPPGGTGGGGVLFDPCSADPQPGYDPSSHGLPACCTDTGPAHCVPSSQIVPALAAQFMACDDSSVCVPDPIIKAGAQYTAPGCTSSVKNSPGVCLSQCIPRVSSNPQSALLGQDGCGDGELCVPCLNPLDGTRTGACEINALVCGLTDGGATDAAPATCPYEGPPIIDPATLPMCSPSCGGAHCLPAVLVPAAQQTLLTACTANGGAPGLCAPDPLIASGGNFVPRSCTSVAGAEGRCMSTCLPSVATQASLLPQDVCAEGEKCAPCFNPTADDPTAPTGACTLACDKPVSPPTILTCPWTGPKVVDPSKFPDCSPSCGGAHCVPSSLVPAAEQSLLAQCPGGFCAPDGVIAAGGKFVPATCTSVAGSEGRCLSTCLPSVAAEASVLPQDTCASGEKCAPCFDPTATDPTKPTGACSLACDKPTQPPTVISCPWTGPPIVNPATFPACSCGGTHCVPSSMVPAAQQSLLAACTGGFCAPDAFIASAGKLKPTACTSVAGAEGRCLSTCLPPIAARAGELPTDVCASGEKCAPCFDPTAADPTAPTGACSIGCDMPVKSPVVLTCPWTGPNLIDPATFPACSPACGGAHCVPASMVPASQQALLAACPGGFCAPDPIIATDNNYVPSSCVSIAGAEGRCVSTCLPSVAAEAAVLPQSTCPSGTRCAPCYNPTAADPTVPTGACSIGCDHPTQPPVTLTCPWTGPAVINPATLPSCASASCSNAHCLPAQYVPVAQQSQLAACPGGFCTPDTVIQAGGDYKPPTCTSIAGAEGRCLSTCLPSVASQASLLPQSTCAVGTRCAPCYNPTDANPNAPTGACTTASCDMPTRPPVVLTCPWNGPAVINPAALPSCSPSCGGAHCLPAQYVPAADQALLATCPGGYCAPDSLIQTAGDYKPPTCTAFAGTGAEGRCLSTCLPLVASQSSLEQSSCASGNKCAPCYDPIKGTKTGACSSSSCDAPANIPYVFPTCCISGGAAQGRCVPTSQVPAGEQGNLKQDVCSSSTYLCVPNENLPGATSGQGCHVSFTIIPPFNYDGSCISNCVNLGLGTIYPAGNCPGNHTCIPCSSAPAGSPGC